MHVTTPPVTAASKDAGDSAAAEEEAGRSSLLMMGFPSRIVEKARSLCACHSRPTRGGYLCSRCSSKVCSLPSSCPACGLTLILSTHLARSYHHLFPLKNWSEVSWRRAAAHADQENCFGCGARFPEVKASNKKTDARMSGARKEGGVSESARYECGTCGRFFCIDCDVFAHEVVHNCPGCQSREGMLAEAADEEMMVRMNGD